MMIELYDPISISPIKTINHSIFKMHRNGKRHNDLAQS